METLIVMVSIAFPIVIVFGAWHLFRLYHNHKEKSETVDVLKRLLTKKNESISRLRELTDKDL